MDLEQMREWVEEYLADLAISHPKNTVIAHRTAMNYLMEYGQWDPMGFVRWLGQKELHVNSLSRYIIRFMDFMEWLALEGRIELDILTERRLRRLVPKDEKALPRQPRESRVQKLFEYIREPVSALGKTPLQMLRLARDQAILEALRSTGGRVHEIVTLKRKDLDPETRRGIVRGKGRKKRTVFFDDVAWHRIAYYLYLTRDVPDKMPVFLSTVGEIHELRTGTVRDVLRKYCALAGVPYFYPHLFRHRFGKRVYAATKDLRATQIALGHASPDTTTIYADVDKEAVAAAHEAADL